MRKFSPSFKVTTLMSVATLFEHLEIEIRALQNPFIRRKENINNTVYFKLKHSRNCLPDLGLI